MIYLLPLILMMFSIFLVLWLGDLYFTVKSTEKRSSAIEVNPIMNALLRLRREFLWIFKIAELAVFSYLVWVISSLNSEIAFNVLLGIIFLYSLLVTQGMCIYLKAVGNASPVVLVFFVMSLIAIIFVRINYDTFLNSVSISNALGMCNSEYVNLYRNCSNNSANMSAYSSNNSEFNFTIPR